MKAYIKKIEILMENQNYPVFTIIEKHLNKIDKDLIWLTNSLDQTDTDKILRSTWNTYIYGNQKITVSSIISIAEILRKSGCKIVSPKDFLTTDYFDGKVNLRSWKLKNNIRYLMAISGATIKEISECTKIDKGNLSLIIRNKVGTYLKNIDLLYMFFRMEKGLDLISPHELLYYPEWGETEYSYLTFRNLTGKSFKSLNTAQNLNRKTAFIYTDQIKLSPSIFTK